jgi:hypothetical protein
MNPTTRALLVLVLCPKTCAYLKNNDPKALEQALSALLSDTTLPAEMRGRVEVVKRVVRSYGVTPGCRFDN